MMILRSAAPSPFGRKVQIALSLLGIDDVKIEPTDTMDAANSLRQQNPLGKIPVLITEDGAPYYDSRVILEYLDDRAGGGKIIPRAPAQRFPALCLQALCDGMIDASILAVYEGRWRAPEKHEPKWLEHQAGKVERALAFLEAARRRSVLTPRFRTWGRSRLPVRSAIAISALRERGARIIRGWSRGSMSSRRACRPLLQPRSRADEPRTRRLE